MGFSKNAKPASGAGGGQVRGGLGGASVGAAALEGLKHQIAHGADVGLNPFQPVGIGLAVIGALFVGSLAFEVQFPVTKDLLLSSKKALSNED